MTPDPLDLDGLDFEKESGLLPVIAQHWLTGEVLMLGYATRETLESSLDGGLLTFHSRSRGAPWTKGETSGNTLRVVSLHGDCDGDAVLARVDPAGPTCHTGARSCFGATGTGKKRTGAADMGPADVAADGRGAAGTQGRGPGGWAPTLQGLTDTLESRRDADPASSYTARLLSDRNHRLKKLGEEAAELAVACADGDVERIREEAADVVYHTLVAAMAAGVDLASILEVLERRRR